MEGGEAGEVEVVATREAEARAAAVVGAHQNGETGRD